MEQSTNLVIFRGDVTKSKLKNELCKNLILWPVQTYRVIAAPKQELNIFKRSILQLVLAGETQSIDIAKLLCLDHKFVTYLIKEEMSLLIKSRARGLQLTNEGVGRLKNIEKTYDDTKLQEFYFFADALTGKLLPRVERAIPALSSDVLMVNDKGYISISVGTKGKRDNHLSPFQVSFPKSDIVQPTESSFNNALRSYTRSVQNLDVTMDEEYRTLSESEAQIEMREISGIKSITPDEKAYLLTALMDSNNDERNWSLYDPFGMGVNSEFFPLVDIVSEYIENEGKQHPFTDKVTKYLGYKVNSEEKLSSSEEHKILREQAEMYVLGELPDGVNETVKKQIMSAAVEYEKYSAQKNLKEYEQENFTSSFLRDVSKSLETLFKEVLWNREKDPYSFKPIKAKIGKNSKIHYTDAKTILEQLANSMGFTSNHTMEGVIRNQHNDIKKYCREGSGGLKARVIGSLLTANRIVRHPLRQAVKEMPRIIEDIFEIQNLRNPGSHGGSEETLLEPHRLKQVLDKQIKFIRIITEKNSAYQTDISY